MKNQIYYRLLFVGIENYIEFDINSKIVIKMIKYDVSEMDPTTTQGQSYI